MHSRYTKIVQVLVLLLAAAAAAAQRSQQQQQQQQQQQRWACDRLPADAELPPASGDGGFELQLRPLNSTAKLHKFVPGASYSVIIRSRFPGVTFTNFFVTAVAHSASPEQEASQPAGQLHPAGSSSIRQQPGCPHVATGSSSGSSWTTAQLLWTAPLSTAFCASLRVSVVRSRQLVFKDHGMLTKTVCPSFETPAAGAVAEAGEAGEAGEVGEEDGDMMRMRRRRIDECCACGHAVYRLQVRGLWSRFSHPREFPTDSHEPHWTSIIGASHSESYNIFYMGGKAGHGVKSVCTIGDTTGLEKEFKEKGGWNILNVIKTQGLWGVSHLSETRTALFSVNRTHHLLSFLSMLGPSPDWCVGADDVDVCESGCTWRRQLRVPLLPWDAGVRTGDTYKPANISAEDKPIRFLGNANLYSRGPFATDGNGRALPVAELVLTRTRPQQDWRCEEEGIQAERPQADRPGKAGRRREPQWRQENQQQTSLISTYPDMIQKKMRMKCQVSAWSSWSGCSVTCGSGGQRRRERRLQAALAAGECERLFHLNETEPCSPSQRQCQRRECELTNWGSWGPCQAECQSIGKQQRYRSFYSADRCPAERRQSVEVQQMRSCFRSCDARSICSQAFGRGSRCSGGEGTFYYYNLATRTCLPFYYRGCKGTKNRFSSSSQCLRFCKRGLASVSAAALQSLAELQRARIMAANGLTEPCKQPSDSGATCGGVGSSVRWYFDPTAGKCMHFSYNGCGGNENKFFNKMQCQRSCKHLMPSMGQPSDCRVSNWGPWGPCSAECGGQRRRVRWVQQEPANGGRACPPTEQSSACPACCEYTAWAAWSPCSRTCSSASSLLPLPSIRERRRQRATPLETDCTARTVVQRQECRQYSDTRCPQ